LGFFKESKPEAAMDNMIIRMYGSLSHEKTANLEKASQIAFRDLLCECIDQTLVQNKAAELFAEPIPYSTNDLALSVAFAFFRDPSRYEYLKEAQMIARLRLLKWVEAGLVAKPLAMAFEITLYELFKPPC